MNSCFKSSSVIIDIIEQVEFIVLSKLGFNKFSPFDEFNRFKIWYKKESVVKFSIILLLLFSTYEYIESFSLKSITVIYYV